MNIAYLGESFKAGSVYPILVWQNETPTTVPVTGVTLDKTSVTLTPGLTVQLTPTVLPTDATNQAVAWSSDNTAVATVSDSGLVTAIAPGTANIPVTTADGGFTATCSVAVSVTS